ncbi:diguanylate cyclase (GGDEF)-like protein [Aquabacter spiritensis]|uniref:diguanylate cyclase n=2 Tax=Aquabacter spiritensis TaxID=933073 RepID=A0A4V2UXP7_9HYPH|nr:diguanylate cyclase (GGDEF)-like protein [Aquabacter spiritensis]
MSVAQQLSIVTAVVSLTGIAALSLSSAGLSRQEMIRRITSDMRDTAGTLARQLDTDMFERFTDVRQLAGMAAIAPLWEGDPAGVRALLDQLQTNLPNYSWIGFARPDGTVAAATRGMLEGASVAARPWFAAGLKGAFVGDVHEAMLLAKLLETAPSGEPMRFVDVAFPVYSADRRLLGVLGAHLSFEWAERLRQGALGSHGDTDIWLLSQDGAILLGPDLAAPPFPPARVAEMRRASSGAFEDTRDGTAILTGFAVADGEGDYPGLGWIVVARQDSSVAFAIPTRVGATIIAIGTGVLLVSLILSVLVARLITRPLDALTEAAGEIGRDPRVTMLPRLRGNLEVIQLSGALRALMRRLGSAETRVVQTAQQYQEDLAALRKLADSDPLTGLMNRRSFRSVADTALRGTRSSDKLGILMADIDHFKVVNDTYGHAAGDAVIRHVGACIGDALRVQDRVARFGGEEFVVLLLDISERDMLALAERIRTAIRSTSVAFEDRQIRVTVSFGAALARPDDRDVDAVIERADHALYEAKAAGRDRVVLSTGFDRAA